MENETKNATKTPTYTIVRTIDDRFSTLLAMCTPFGFTLIDDLLDKSITLTMKETLKLRNLLNEVYPERS